MPQAIIAFLESKDFEDAIRQQALSYLDEELSWIYYMKEKLRLDNKGQ